MAKTLVPVLRYDLLERLSAELDYYDMAISNSRVHESVKRVQLTRSANRINHIREALA